MTLNRILTLATAFIAATILLYFLGAHRQSRQTRVFVANIPQQPDVEVAEVKEYFPTACPDMVLIKDEPRADYSLGAMWAGSKWRVLVNRKDQTLILFEDVSADAIETFRQTCKAIRDDSKEVADFDAHTAPMPVGRYSLNSANPGRVFLLDTKTGAVWELKPQPLGDNQEFERISVDGLYNRRPFGP